MAKRAHHACCLPRVPAQRVATRAATRLCFLRGLSKQAHSAHKASNTLVRSSSPAAVARPLYVLLAFPTMPESSSDMARRAWLQAVMAQRILPIQHALALYKTATQLTGAEFDKDNFLDFMSDTAETLNTLGLDLREIIDQTTSHRLIGIVGAFPPLRYPSADTSAGQYPPGRGVGARVELLQD